MSLRPRKPLVLTFTLGAFVLGALMVYVFGGREIFTRHEQFLLYFDDTVNGLAPGSLVKFKGVPIGSVDSILLKFRDTSAAHRIPVLIHLNADLLQRQLGVLEDLSDPAVLAAVIHRGLRAELDVEHFTTGGMFVSLDFHPAAAMPKPVAGIAGIAVIPTVASAALAHMNWAEKKIAWLPTVDFQAKIGEIGDQLDKIGAIVSAIPYAEYHQEIVDVTKPLADFNFPVWQRDLNDMLARFDTGQQAIAAGSQQYSAASQDFVNMNTAVRQNLAQTDADLTHLRTQLAPTAPWLKDLTQNLQDASAVMQNLTHKTNNLEEQPDILPKLAQ